MAGAAALALLLAGAAPADDTAALIARIEALEAKNIELQARLDRLSPPPSPAAHQAPEYSPAVTLPTQHRAAIVSLNPWDRGYVGLQARLRRATNQEDFISDFYEYSATRRNSHFIGVQVGKLWQHQSLVLGGELSASIPISNGLREHFDVRPPFGSPDSILRYRRTYSVALKGQLGLAFGDILVYAAAGVESSRDRVLRSQTLRSVTHDRVTAPFWGVGIAEQISQNLALEVEGRYGYSAQGLFQDDANLILKVNYLIP